MTRADGKWEVSYRNPGARVSDIAVATDDVVIAVLYRGEIVRSIDGGKTWQKIPLPSPYDELFLGAAAFADATHGWLVGHRGTILSTSDGGETWRFEAQVQSFFLLDVEVSDNRIFAVGEDGAIFWRERPRG